MAEPFTFDVFVQLPRLSGLRLSPDGSRLVVSVAVPHTDGKRMASSIWQVDPNAAAAPRRLTRSAKGETGAAFLPDGSILFTSARPDPDARPDGDEDPPAALWLLPSGGGEARLLAAPRAGVTAVRVARSAGTIVLASGLFPGVASLDDDAAREKARKDAGVGALLLETFPIRFWDHYLGPREPRLLVADPPSGEGSRLGELRDLAPDAGLALLEAVADASPDGSTIVVPWRDASTSLVRETANLAAIERATDARRALTTGEHWYEEPAVSPDGRWVAAVHGTLGDPETAPVVRIHLLELATGAVRDLTAGLDRWPHSPAWAADSRAVFFAADDDGETRPFRVDVASGAITRLAIDGTYTDLCPTPDGTVLYALRSRIDRPPHVVRLAADRADQVAEEIPSPAVAEADLPRRGTVERVEAAAADGTPIRSWLVLPAGASAEAPVPLVVFVHGGPLGSWTGWHWRWNAHLLAERGYAVLLPDPAFSTGYGQPLIQRGWGRWGEAPYTDVLAAVDGAVGRPDIEATRVALMGGSFGGYMANWVAGQTDRFRAIVTHASLWDLRGLHGSTDHGPSWEQEFGDPYLDPTRYVDNSPSEHVARIRTPMLVIHGELDHRVPISEALRLWTDLRRHGVAARFLYFPDENHWILKPQNARLWYAAVLSFLDEHVLGSAWQRPELL